MTSHRPKIGLALGSGSARGWSHIGVLRVLERAGFVPDIVCGTSIGALVGAAYAAGQLDRVEAWARSLTWPAVVKLLDFTTVTGGLIQGGRLLAFFRSHFEDREITQLPVAFGAVATELLTGRELWLREGSVVDAVRASMALPGLFLPAQVDGRLIVDGGLVNPVPVSLCRAMGADVVVAVDLNWDLIGRHLEGDGADPAPPAGLLGWLPRGLGRLRSGPGASALSMFDVLGVSLNIMQVRITRSRLAGEPADVMIRPRVSDLGLMDFHRADTAIAAGEAATEDVLRELAQVLGPRLPLR
ncbi:patatin-like phospholipase family protein [Ramlibacter sp. AW1]|uniref:Patatin-like phospholipase family protein n=1 Tax=Ramlibacter aurantiacus TaxID=2801330 RepID=A0A937D4B6_9BURK|nr:patatin-like phospholipase family protein [Ramlibacter aurantiacus]MBL0420172.1 patatin-like phospholipase family protein [Ramlibacter aurantiacus]